MKVLIQIPCHDEEATLPLVLGELPRQLEGVTSVEWLIIDDGSTDRPADVARSHGVDHVVSLPRRQGLARAFLAGIEASIEAGADIVVNTDGDYQYRAADIPALIRPILEGRADIVVGSRPVDRTAHFSPLKRFLQRMGSRATRALSGTDVEDSPSGFRAFTRDAAMRLHVYNRYTYTVETIIQAGRKGMAIASVPVGTNPELRRSRLVTSTGSYVARQLLTMVRVFMTYKPFRFFAIPGAVLFGAGFLLGLRFLVSYVGGSGVGHVQSLILAALLMGTGFFLGVVGLIADLLAVNRVLLEGLGWRLRRLELGRRAGKRFDADQSADGEAGVREARARE